MKTIPHVGDIVYLAAGLEPLQVISAPFRVVGDRPGYHVLTKKQFEPENETLYGVAVRQLEPRKPMDFGSVRDETPAEALTPLSRRSCQTSRRKEKNYAVRNTDGHRINRKHHMSSGACARGGNAARGDGDVLGGHHAAEKISVWN